MLFPIETSRDELAIVEVMLSRAIAERKKRSWPGRLDKEELNKRSEISTFNLLECS